jgi:hypothetical protein
MKKTEKPLRQCKQAQSVFEPVTSRVAVSGIGAIAAQHLA